MSAVLAQTDAFFGPSVDWWGLSPLLVLAGGAVAVVATNNLSFALAQEETVPVGGELRRVGPHYMMCGIWQRVMAEEEALRRLGDAWRPEMNPVTTALAMSSRPPRASSSAGSSRSALSRRLLSIGLARLTRRRNWNLTAGGGGGPIAAVTLPTAPCCG